MPFLGGETGGICQWALLTGRLTDDEVDKFAAHISNLRNAKGPGYVVIDLAYRIALPTPLQRQRIATAVDAATRTTHSVAAHALVTNSVTARGVLTAINWFVERTFDEKVFGAPEEALAWLSSFNPKLDARAVLDDIARAAPSFAGMRW